MAGIHQNPALRGSNFAVVKYDLIAALNAAAFAKSEITKDMAQRLTLLLVARYNWRRDELSIGYEQLQAIWNVDLRRVKRILADMKRLSVLIVKVRAVKGRVTTYRLGLDAIVEATRPFWARLGSDIADRLVAAFPPIIGRASSTERLCEVPEPTQTSDDKAAATESRVCPIKTELRSRLSPSAFDRWIAPLRFARSGSRLEVLAPTPFVASYVERTYSQDIARSSVRVEQALSHITFTTMPRRRSEASLPPPSVVGGTITYEPRVRLGAA
jgi:hypothetical protein